MIREFLTLQAPASQAEKVRAEQEAWRWRKRWFWRVCGALTLVAVPTVWFGGQWGWGGVAYELTAAVGFFFLVEAKLLAFTGYPNRAVFYRWVAGVWYLLLLGALVYVTLKQGIGNREMPPVENITRISIHTTNFCETLNVISDSTQVAAITGFVNSRLDDWGGIRDIAGTPVGQIKVYLHDDRESVNDGVVGTIGVGRGFLEMRMESRPVSRRELREFARLIGVPAAWFRGGCPAR